eukprot:CAMPEP_0183407556 /NCGR_PEP_ID=MMETSP0370-20130417/17448_1 /TAXON_ID=268820 /ORGANISM="Peridinium aciculiferum, Strain PAER-2" /LENGTH=71 /DNA_ID=CAMNT_0025589943 /DNA_START=310 /DNA_END=521 /DNA_ORIENTATION=+
MNLSVRTRCKELHAQACGEEALRILLVGVRLEAGLLPATVDGAAVAVCEGLDGAVCPGLEAEQLAHVRLRL